MDVPVGLVVDDDAAVREFLAATFRRRGMRILEAQSGLDALGLLQTATPDFIVTDIEMPALDGVELCRRLRQRPATARVPIVVVTGAAFLHGEHATRAGCDVVLAKPCSPAVLLATVRRLLVGVSEGTGTR
jgi:two-component system, OmpR family, phosphate regulon response regulator PhoB